MVESVAHKDSADMGRATGRSAPEHGSPMGTISRLSRCSRYKETTVMTEVRIPRRCPGFLSVDGARPCFSSQQGRRRAGESGRRAHPRAGEPRNARPGTDRPGRSFASAGHSSQRHGTDRLAPACRGPLRRRGGGCPVQAGLNSGVRDAHRGGAAQGSRQPSARPSTRKSPTGSVLRCPRTDQASAARYRESPARTEGAAFHSPVFGPI